MGGRLGIYSFGFIDSGVLKGKVRVGEQVTVVKLGIKLIYMNSTILDGFGLTFRIFLNRETDYPNRSKGNYHRILPHISMEWRNLDDETEYDI
ncbi:MAG: hypothetical protein QW231_02095 [Candidatus Bathyarchaeia archaeon]